MRNAVRLLFLILLLPCIGLAQKFTLADYYTDNPELDRIVDSIFYPLEDSQRVGQMIVTTAGELGHPDYLVKKAVTDYEVGGVIYLKGQKEAHRKLINEINAINKKRSSIAVSHSMDAEPSLLKGRIQSDQQIISASEIKTVRESDSIVQLINTELIDLGIKVNYAPVVDLSLDNEAIKKRSYGKNPERVIEMAEAFIKATQKDNIVATAKHFPGHGFVKGDTHKQSVYIDGALQELPVYKPLIDAGVISIMVAHIVVRNNEKWSTDELPSTCSRKIVTDLLRNEMNFKGLIITDAMNIMKAVTIIPNAPLKASMAGCDIILMPPDEGEAIDMILKEMMSNFMYRAQVYQSVKRIVRMKVCSGVIEL